MIDKKKELSEEEHKNIKMFMDKAIEGADQTILTIPVGRAPATEQDLQTLFSKIRNQFKVVHKLQAEFKTIEEVAMDKAKAQKTKMKPIKCSDCEEVIGFCQEPINCYYTQCAFCLNSECENKN